MQAKTTHGTLSVAKVYLYCFIHYMYTQTQLYGYVYVNLKPDSRLSKVALELVGTQLPWRMRTACDRHTHTQQHGFLHSAASTGINTRKRPSPM